MHTFCFLENLPQHQPCVTSIWVKYGRSQDEKKNGTREYVCNDSHQYVNVFGVLSKDLS